ncbi:hypothetical protein LX36DRAFT_709769 [Colletotrichum falcatum]|nr:hypothetical protein LX36DRAFT_709769 [Colletotrichum falcatum]
MACVQDPPVLDRWNCLDLDRGPPHRLGENVDLVDVDGLRAYADCRQPSYTALGQPQCFAFTLFNDRMPSQCLDPAGDMQIIVADYEVLANVQPLDFGNAKCPSPDLAPPPSAALLESPSVFGMANLATKDACLSFRTLRRLRGPADIMMALPYRSQHASACDMILTTASRLAKDLNFTQPTHLANNLAPHIAESATLYRQAHLFQQPLAPETEPSPMPAATFDVGRLARGETTPFPQFNPHPFLMADITTGWPYGAKPVSATHDDMDGNMAQYSPLSDLYEVPDEADNWAVLMQQDTLFTGAFEMASFDYPTMGTDHQTTTASQTTDYQITASPEDIFNDPAVQYDIEQSLLTFDFDFNSPLPDLSASGYLSGADQLSCFGSTNTSPFEPALDFFPDVGLSFSSFVFPGSANGSPADTTATTTTTTTTAGTASPGSDVSSAASHPFRCAADGCAKSFRKEAQLKQHQRVHRKALVCDICRAADDGRPEHKFAQVRDLERHLQARHRDVAERANVRSEVRRCPHPGCEHEGRRDNVSRHHKSKHGRELKWKRGVPHVVG